MPTHLPFHQLQNAALARLQAVQPAFSEPTIGHPPVGTIAQQLLRELEGVQESSGLRVPNVALSRAPEHYVSAVPLDPALTDHPISLPTGHVLTMFGPPSGLSTLSVRLRSLDSQPIDILQAGNQIRTRNPFDRIFITTAPALPVSLGIMAGGAEMDTVLPPGPKEVIDSGNQTNALTGANGWTFTFPAVPANETHIYENLTLRPGLTNTFIAIVNVITGFSDPRYVRVLIGPNAIVPLLQDNHDGPLSATVLTNYGHNRPLVLYPGWNLVVNSPTAQVAANTIRIDWTLRKTRAPELIQDSIGGLTFSEP